MKQDLQVIKFYDNEIFTVEKDGEHYVAMKPICEGIGLQWQAQFNRIKRHPVLSEVVSMMDTTCLGIDGKKYVKKNDDVAIENVEWVVVWCRYKSSQTGNQRPID